MSKVLQEYFNEVRSSDAFDYGYGTKFDFLIDPIPQNYSCDWIITNPPFRLGEEFILRAIAVARVGIAILARSVFLESVGRYHAIFKEMPPSKFAQFTERVPMVKGRLDRKASTATGYAWLVWEKGLETADQAKLTWIPPCRKILERDGDYSLPSSLLVQANNAKKILF